MEENVRSFDKLLSIPDPPCIHVDLVVNVICISTRWYSGCSQLSVCSRGVHVNQFCNVLLVTDFTYQASFYILTWTDVVVKICGLQPPGTPTCSLVWQFFMHWYTMPTASIPLVLSYLSDSIFRSLRSIFYRTFVYIQWVYCDSYYFLTAVDSKMSEYIIYKRKHETWCWLTIKKAYRQEYNRL